MPKRKGRKQKRLDLAAGDIVEEATLIKCGSLDELLVVDHVEVDGSVVAKACLDAELVATVVVPGRHVTRIAPDEPYRELRYGTVIQRKEVSGGEVLYWVAWEEEGEIKLGDVAERLIGAETGRRVVKKRPSWTETQAWTDKEWKAIMAAVARG